MLQGDLLAAVLEGSLGRLSTLLPVPRLTVDGGEPGGLQGKGAPTEEPNGHALSLPQSQSSGLALVLLSPNMMKPYTETQYKTRSGASLVAQWLRICLLMQGTRVRALVWEDPTCHGAAGPVSHNC